MQDHRAQAGAAHLAASAKHFGSSAGADAELVELRAALARAGDAVRAAEAVAEKLADAVRVKDQALCRQDLLRSEFDHRIANGLQVVLGLLRLETERHPDPAVRDFFARACARVEGLMAVTALLHGQADGSAVDLAAFVGQVCCGLRNALGADRDDRSLVVEVEPVLLAPRTVHALGLVLNELLTNAVQHGFAPGAAARIRLRGRRVRDGAYRLTVADNGRGLPAEFAVDRARGLGLRLVRMMAQEVGGVIKVRSGPGACVTLTFPVPAGR